jgi:hypothetical protein
LFSSSSGYSLLVAKALAQKANTIWQAFRCYPAAFQQNNIHPFSHHETMQAKLTKYFLATENSK